MSEGQMEQVQIPMDIVMNRLRMKLQDAEWRVILLESQIEAIKQESQDVKADPEIQG